MNTTSTQTPATYSNGSFMDTVLDALRSPGAMMIALGLALAAQGKHTADVFTYFSHPGTPVWLSYVFAGAVEVAVLLFVLNKHKLISYLFALATFATNMVYYAIGGIDMQGIALVPVVLLSALLPGVIVGYSHTIAENALTVGIAAEQAVRRTTPRRWHFWRKPQNDATTSNSATSPVQAPVALSTGTTTAQDANGATTTPAAESPKQAKATSKPAPPLRKVGKTNEYGMTDTALGDMLGVSRQRVSTMRNDGTLTTRVARELPQLEPIHTNGFNHD